MAAVLRIACTGKEWNWGSQLAATATIQVRDDSGWDQGSRDGDGEKRSGSRFTLNSNLQTSWDSSHSRETGNTVNSTIL